MDLLNEHIPYYLHSMFDMIGEENFLKICKMYRESSIYIIVQNKKDTINLENVKYFVLMKINTPLWQ